MWLVILLFIIWAILLALILAIEIYDDRLEHEEIGEKSATFAYAEPDR